MLNALRREAVERLENGIIHSKFPENSLREAKENTLLHAPSTMGRSLDASLEKNALSVLVATWSQLEAFLSHPLAKRIETLYLEEEAMLAYLEEKPTLPNQISVAYVMPYILRGKDLEEQREFLRTLCEKGICKVLVRNVEELSLAKSLAEENALQIITDASVYSWNLSAVTAFEVYANKITLPVELNAKEMRPLRSDRTEQIIYGFLPLMITANCLFKTNASCQKASKIVRHTAQLKDRYGKVFTVLTNCKYCYNTIYNTVPLSLHKKYNKSLPGSVRLQFSIEEPGDMKAILDYYVNWIDEVKTEFPVAEYTTVHENRQVE
jgi:putative protease